MSGPRTTEGSPKPDPRQALVVVPTYNERETVLQLAEAVLTLPGSWRLLSVPVQHS